MKLFCRYLRSRVRSIAAYLLFLLIFSAWFVLYRLPVEAVLYPAFLCGLAGACFILGDFLRVRRKHRRLAELAQRTAGMMEDFPEAKSIDDGDYQAIIESLREEVRTLETALETRVRDTEEYYTVWAHQIKTPIAAMRLTLQNEDSPLSRKLSADLLRIEQYVEMVLTYLRLDSPTSDYVFASCAVDGVVRQAVAKFAPEFIDRKLRMEFTPTQDTVVTDEKWLAFVVEQVVSNALKYTREGGIKIYPKAPGLLCIEDTGIGIAPEDLPRIFEKGYTGCNGRRDKQASGIGLYLCRRVCDNLGVGISVTSQVGAGTVVTLDLRQENGRKE